MPPRDRRSSRPPMNTSQLFQGAADTGASDLDYLLAGGAEELAPRARERGLPIREVPTSAIAPDPHQLRRLPHPHTLRELAAAGDLGVTSLVAGLRDLGASMRAHGQIQPAIVYADTDATDPAITHRLLHGQRRWSAAILADIPMLWVVEVPRPSEIDRLQRQFDENERREDFTDIERAWAILAVRDALTAERGSEAPWTEVETRLRLSDSRRRDLLRLLRLTEEGQQIALRQRWSEWTLRPLHMAISAGAIDADAATAMLKQLAARDEDVTAPAVAAAIDAWRARVSDPSTVGRGATPGVAVDAGAAFDPAEDVAFRPHALVARLRKIRQGMERVGGEVTPSLDGSTRADLLREAHALMLSLENLVHRLDDLPPGVGASQGPR